MNYFIQLLTYFRILIAPIIFILITLYDLYGWALFLFFLASISDYWDGFLARKYNLESIIGAVLDPIADKILAILRPMIVVSVSAGQVYKVALDDDVSMFCAVNVLNAFAIFLS